MALTVNTNIASLSAQRNLTASQDMLSTSLERLSSGLRINSAKDDSAGLAISSRFEAQIRGLNQGIRNANDGISLAQTAEGALSEVTSNLQRIRELAVQSSNATNSNADRTTLQAEVTALAAEIDRVASQTKFNNISLLDGSFTAKNFQVGANNGETVTIASVVNARSSSLGANTTTLIGSDIGAVFEAANATAAASGVGAQNLTITTVDGGTTGNAAVGAGDSAKEMAAAINAASAAKGNGVTATASNDVFLTDLSADGTVSFTLSTEASGAAVGSTASISGAITATDYSALVNSINGNYGSTGITAEAVTMTDGNAGVKLSSTLGDDIVIETFLNDGGGTVKATKELAETTSISLTSGNTDSTRAYGSVSLSSSQGAVSVASSSGTTVVAGNEANTASTISALSVSTVANAQTALLTIDAAIDTVSAGRGALGAVQNRFDSIVASQQVASENLSASKSRVQDADFAAETAQLTKAQILQQSGIAMLAQANSVPQNVLALLQ